MRRLAVIPLVVAAVMAANAAQAQAAQVKRPHAAVEVKQCVAEAIVLPCAVGTTVYGQFLPRDWHGLKR